MQTLWKTGETNGGKRRNEYGEEGEGVTMKDDVYYVPFLLN